MPARVDQFGELRGGYGDAGNDRLDAPCLLLEVPDKFAAGAFARDRSGRPW